MTKLPWATNILISFKNENCHFVYFNKDNKYGSKRDIEILSILREDTHIALQYSANKDYEEK